MKTRRLLADYGMILVLVLLCAFFSAVTTSEQSPTGEAAASQVVQATLKAMPPGARVLVAASDQPGDAAFAARVERDLKALFPVDRWNDRHLQIIFFGREYCPARRHDLAVCPICSWAATKKRIREETGR